MNKMIVYVSLISIWIILGNVWHGILIFIYSGGGRPSTISEHAVKSKRLLWAHRLVHSLPLIVFMPMIFDYLVPSGYILAAFTLMSGAIFDALETLTLNKSTAPVDSPFNVHHLTTWLMALSYFIYAILISEIAEVNPWIYLPVLAACVVLLFIAGKKVFKGKFLIMQMSYFILVSLVVLVANVKLMFP